VLTHFARQTEAHGNSVDYRNEMGIWPEIGARIAAVPLKGHDPTRAECGDHTQNQDLKSVLELAPDLQ